MAKETVVKGSKRKAHRQPGRATTTINSQTQAGNNGNLGIQTPGSGAKGAPGNPVTPGGVVMKSGTAGGSGNAMKSGTS